MWLVASRTYNTQNHCTSRKTLPEWHNVVEFINVFSVRDSWRQKIYILADFNIKNANNVNIRNFHCDKININTSKNINIEKCYAENIQLTTLNGNITTKNIIQASNILLQCENGVRWL